MLIRVDNLTPNEYIQYREGRRTSLIIELSQEPRIREVVILRQDKAYPPPVPNRPLITYIKFICKTDTFLNNKQLYILGLTFRFGLFYSSLYPVYL